MVALLESFWSWLISSGLIWYAAAGLISFIFSKKSQLDHWVEENPRLGGLAKILRSVGLDPWMLLQGLWLLVRGKLPAHAKNVTLESNLESEPPPTPKN
jgi:hypothetical protein